MPSRLIRHLFQLEEVLRETAGRWNARIIDRDRCIYNLDEGTFRGDLLEISIVTHNASCEAQRYQYFEEIEDISNVLDSIFDTVRHIVNVIKNSCRFEGDSRLKCAKIPSKYSKELIEQVYRAFHKNCGNLLPYLTEVCPSGYLDGLSNCVHVVAEELSKKIMGNEKCIIIERHELSEKLCRKWDDLTEKYFAEAQYSPPDYSRLIGVVKGSKCIFRVGSAVGHAFHIDLDKAKLEYYDRDRDVVETVRSYLGGMGFLCNYNEASGKLTCIRDEKISEKDLDALAYILANVTSLDFNLANLKERVREYVSEEWVKNVEKIMLPEIYKEYHMKPLKTVAETFMVAHEVSI